MKEEIEQLFGGKDAEGQNALFHVIKNRGYRFYNRSKDGLSYSKCTKIHRKMEIQRWSM